MTVTAIPSVTRARLAPYTAASGDMVLPGCYGVSRGQAITGDLIRHASGSGRSRLLYIGNGRIVEVAPPAVRDRPGGVTPLRDLECPVFADRAPAREDLRPGVALVGRPYDYPAYTGFALKVLRPRDGAEHDPVFKADHWQVCSALVADCYAYAGIRLEPGLRDLSLAGAARLDTWVAQSA